MSIADWFRPKWKHSNPLVRQGALERLKDHHVLADVSDQEDLAHIAIFGSDNKLRIAALGLITEQAQLVYVAKSAKDLSIGTAAAQRIADERYLVDIACSSGSPELRSSVLSRIADQASLAEVVRRGEHRDARLAAIARLADQELLVEIAQKDNDVEVRRTARGRIADATISARLEQFEIERAKCAEKPTVDLFRRYRDSPEERPWQLLKSCQAARPYEEYPDFDVAYLHVGRNDDVPAGSWNQQLLTLGLEKSKRKSLLLFALATDFAFRGMGVRAFECAIQAFHARETLPRGSGDHVHAYFFLWYLYNGTISAEAPPVTDLLAMSQPGVDLRQHVADRLQSLATKTRGQLGSVPLKVGEVILRERMKPTSQTPPFPWKFTYS